MKLLKPTWVTHDGRPIFSIDIHPDGSRFATGGQGEDSGRIVIWNMSPVIDEKFETDNSVPKMLCQMDNHLACVNCVRWSISGEYLASGGDDKLVMIWKITNYQTGGGTTSGESWRCFSTLREHNGDVLDIAWAPHDTWLASCSVDNTVIVWNALKMPEVVAILKGHTGLVKGVTWDPVGKYLASQSDDKTLRVWRTSDWKEEKGIAEPFKECGGTTHFLRLSWSPDGQYLLSAHAMNGGGPTAQVIEREGWRHDKDFVGHRKAVVCVRFNSNILQMVGRSSSRPQMCCCCAVGSRDCSLSVWLTALKRPRVIIHQLFSKSVVDVSWSSTGFQLMACSWDGSVAFVEFTEEELGRPLPDDEKNSLLERMYGRSLATSSCQSSIVENPDFLSAMEKAERQASEVAAPAQPSHKPATSHTPVKGPINKQIETRTSDGKRRITPIYIPPAPDAGEPPLPPGTTGTQQPTFSSSSESKSRIVIEKRDDIVHPNVSGSGKSCEGVSNGAGSVTGAAPIQQGKTTTVTFTPTAQSDGAAETQRPASGPTVKRRLDASSKGGGGGKRGRPPLSQEQPPAAPLLARHQQPATTASDHPGITLPPLGVEKRLTVQVTGARQRLEVENDAVGTLCRLRLWQDGNTRTPVWEEMLGSPVSAAVSNSRFTVVASADCSLHLRDTRTGNHLYPAVVLSAAPSRLALNAAGHVMVVTSRGHVSVWDLTKKRSVLANCSMLPIMHVQSGSVVTIHTCSLTEKGFPIVSLSTGKVYSYSHDLSCWVVVADSCDPVQKGSQYRGLACPPEGAPLSVSGLQSLPPAVPPGGRTLHPAGPQCTLSFLRRQLATCEALGSAAEYRTWLLAMVRFYVQEGMELELRAICDDLLGPTHSGAKLSKRQDELMGYPKHTLLKDILVVMGTNLKMQRLYTEYNDQLNMVSRYKLHNGTTE